MRGMPLTQKVKPRWRQAATFDEGRDEDRAANAHMVAAGWVKSWFKVVTF